MKRVLILCGLMLLLCGVLTLNAYAEEETELIVATDLHYIAPGLTDHGAAFTALTENADGKLMRYVEEITDAFLEEISARKPRALLLTGDLSFNGALLSHTALAAKLSTLEAQGVPVYVLPGNHDLYNSSAASFSDDIFTRVPSATSADFKRIYWQFGFDEALDMDEDSLSYVVSLDEMTRLLMLDFNTAHDPCGISDKSLDWVEKQLQNAHNAHQRILAAGHQNLFQLTMFKGGYVIQNAERLAALFRQYGVELYLSGHLHCQHWKTEQGLTEIATSALSVSPCQYGILHMMGERLHYQTRETDVAAWAKAQGRTEPELLNFPQYAASFFDGRNRDSTAETLALFGYTQEEIERMTEYIVEMNRAYFSGDLRGAALLAPSGEIGALFDSRPSLYTAYILSVRPDCGMDFRFWEKE